MQNTYQLVLATDGYSSYAIFLYEDIAWTEFDFFSEVLDISGSENVSSSGSNVGTTSGSGSSGTNDKMTSWSDSGSGSSNVTGGSGSSNGNLDAIGGSGSSNGNADSAGGSNINGMTYRLTRLVINNCQVDRDGIYIYISIYS